MRSTILFLALLFSVSVASAHALWIETSASGKKGVPHDVKVFYGEYSEGKPEKIADWYSDVREFTLWLVSPDQSKIKLTTTAAGDHFTASFTPSREGVYTLLVSHAAKDLGVTTKYEFNASALVAVGQSKLGNDPKFNDNPITLYADPSAHYKVNLPICLVSLLKSAPGAGLHVEVFSPSGWNRAASTDDQGTLSFTPLWSGRYMVEVSKTEKEEGEHHGARYEKVWRCATISFVVEK